MSYSSTMTETYSIADIEVVMRRVTADLVMIANSTNATTEERARNWGHDIELLAKNGYLKAVDLTLLSAGVEQKATRFEVNSESGELSMSRPGGVLWPLVTQPTLRIILFYSVAYSATAKDKMAGKLCLSWSPTDADTSHLSLNANSGRDYFSNGYGMQRKDFTK
jgi:hypothetical protein